LLSAAQIRRLDESKVIILPQRQHPIIADRIKYYEDPILMPLWKAQSGPYPYPSVEVEERATLRETEQAKVAALEKTVAELTETVAALKDGNKAEAIVEKVAPYTKHKAEQRADPAEDIPEEEREVIQENVERFRGVLEKYLSD